MAMMTAEIPAVREPPWSRAILTRASAAAQKTPAPDKRCYYERAGDLSAFPIALAARISTSIDWT